MSTVPSPMSGGLTVYKIQVDVLSLHRLPAPALTEVGAVICGDGSGKGPQEAGGGGGPS